jgi:glycosyltransferase involved in cell wall biosynthesis
MQSKVSIIIPCHNQAQYVEEAIESALNQTHPCEVIVVANGCTDNTTDVCGKYKDIVLIVDEVANLPRARNMGIKEATGEFIICLDSDDYLREDAAEKMLAAYGGSGLVRSDIRMFGDVNRTVTHGNHDNSLSDFIKANRAVTSSLFSKATWKKVGGYDEEMTHGFEDWDLWVRIMAVEPVCNTVCETLMFYRKNGPSLSLYAWIGRHAIIEYMHTKWRAMGIM